MIHHPSLDGLRGIAVLLVVLFHFGYLPVGWIGVQLFFVLSGFLITQGLVETRDYSAGRYFGRFYWRRSLRIFPLNYLALAIAATLFTATGHPSGFERSWPYLATYTTNFGRMLPADVADCFAHFWSLAVEEQFYLVWPALVFCFGPAGFRRIVTATLAAGPLGRWAWSAGLVAGGIAEDRIGKLVYLNPLSHFDAFAVGAAIVVFPKASTYCGARRAVQGALAVWLAAGGLHVVVRHLQGGVPWQTLGYQMYLEDNAQYIWGYSLINLACGALVAYCVSPVTRKGALNWLWLRYVGRVSYGVYLFHWPLLMALDYWLDGTRFAGRSGTVCGLPGDYHRGGGTEL